MSEIKKVPLVSFPSSKVKDKEVENVAKTFRISLNLARSDEDTCPMFNYKEELSSAKRKEKLSKNGIEKGVHKNGLDPFMDENDDDIRKIAIEMEAKYGVSGTPKKKRKGRKDDYADIGMGYDESDSFIDNTDGYDEMIPQNVTTLHGGFYINCGALEFKTDDEASSNISSSSSSEDSSDDDDNVKKKNRKRIISDSDEDDSQKSKKDKAPPMKKPKLSNGQQKIKKKFLTPDKLKPKKKRILPPVMSSNRLAALTEEAPATATAKPTADEETDNKLNKDKDELVYKKPMSLDNITDIINSVASGQHISSFLNNLMNSTAFDNLTPIATIDLNENDDDDDDDESASDSASNNVQFDAKVSPTVEPMETSEEEVVLPENLPHDILSLVNAIKQAAAINVANNTSVFSSQVNDLILSFERKCKCLGKQSRSKIYAYLAAFTKCKKDALVRRAKSLIIQDDDTKLKQSIDLLRKRIEEVMPGIRDTYEQMRKHVEMRKMSSEEETKNLRMPKKTFQWTEEIKKWVRDIYSLKKKQFTTQGVVKETLDVQLETYFKMEIQILWPDNWISINYLMKIAKNEKKPEKPANVINPQISINKTTKQQSTDNKEAISNSTPNLNLNDNSVIRTVMPPNSEVFKKVLNNDSSNHESTNKTSATTLVISKAIAASVANSTKNSEKPLSINTAPLPSLHDKPNLPQVSITPVQQISPSSKQTPPQVNTVECEIVDISTEQAQQKKPVDRLKTISEILKMQQQKKKEAVRSSSPSVPAACQIIDLTSAQPEIKKRPGPKCSKIDLPSKEHVPSSQNAKPSTTIQSATSPPSTQTTSVIIQQPPQQIKSGQQDTAEIQKVMEDLKALQQMTYSPAAASSSNSQSIIKSPSTSQHKPATSSVADVPIQQKPPVSVIALNKNYTSAAVVGQKVAMNNSLSGSGGFAGVKSETSFQEAFQRQFMANLQQQQQQQSGSSGKSNNNSHDKYASSSSSSSGVHVQNKISTASNNNYEPNASGKVKNNSYPAQTTQSAYNIMDDMLANFLTEYGYPLTGQKPKQPSQK